ncbi:MAG: hypothetical protein L6R41_004198 [Letrouitia leprolyta]|nr:MAG: hypothetical protein L6R41_004198 [Letrouitia leprolyta]
MVVSSSSILGFKHNPIKLLTRSHGAIAVCLCSFIYLAWYLPSVNVRHELRSAWSDAPRRLIAFGDSWSDNLQYPVDVPAKKLIPVKEDTQGPVWTEWLCLAIKCNHHDNFARSLPSALTTDLRGAVVDGSILNRTLGAEHGDVTMLSDLKTQVAQWLKFEKKQYTSSRMRDKEKRGTIFTVWFSLWDIWYYSQLTSDAASEAIRLSMDTLFEQLGIIADHWPLGAKIILPEAMDPTFLPGWSTKRTGPAGSDHTAEDQRNAVQLVKQWNAALDVRASNWNKGQIYIYNTNEWMLDQVREAQLVIGDMSDHNGLGKSGSPWKSVHSGCVGSGEMTSPSESQNIAGPKKCSEPDKYLFW